MSLSSQMEKNSIEDDCVDSGAETAGSDCSPMSSGSSERSLGDLQDPFLLSVHIITDPGRAKTLQRAADALLACVHRDLRLVRVSERGAWQPRPKPPPRPAPPGPRPALAVVLFVPERPDDEQREDRLARALGLPPWRYHHTEATPGGRDLFSLEPGSPLWAVRRGHSGRATVRFTVRCRHQNFADTVRLYGLLLRRRRVPAQSAGGDSCSYVVYSNPQAEVQLGLQRLPRGQDPTPVPAAILEFRVRDVGALVPLLPRPCTPISDVRWQTEDYDGNKILLQVRGSTHCRRRHTIGQFDDLRVNSSLSPSPSTPDPAPAPLYGRGPASYRTRRYLRSSSRARQQSQASQPDPLPACEPDASRFWWAGPRARPLLTPPTVGGARCSPASTSPPPCSALLRHVSMAPPFRLNVDALMGAEETNVDTGRKVDGGGAVDFSVVSAYSRPLPGPALPRPLSAPPTRDPDTLYRGRPPQARPAPLRKSHSISAPPSFLRRPRPHSDCLPVWYGRVGIGSEVNGPQDTPAEEEEEQEFYI